VSRLGVIKKLGGNRAKTADRRDIPYHMTSCLAIKAGRKKGEESSQVTLTCDEALLSWRWLNTCLLMGTSE